MKKVSFLFLLLWSLSVNAQVTQQWVARYNGLANKDDVAKSIAVDKQGNVYVTGNSTGTYQFIGYLTIKYNSEGVEQWATRYNGLVNQGANPTSLAIDNNGNVYVTGYSYNGVSLDYATVKYNSEGVEQWVARYDENKHDDRASSIAVDKEGNICVTGHCWNGSDYDYVTVKYNPEGNEMWVRIYDGPGHASAYTIKTDDAGNVYVTGLNSPDIVTIKYDAAGTQQWVARIKGTSEADFNTNSLAIDNKGNVYVTGSVYPSPTTGVASDYATIKYNAAGAKAGRLDHIPPV
jgi:streptogramin lyase